MTNPETARTLLDLVSFWAREKPQGVRVTLCGKPVTYRALHTESLRCASTLSRAGVRRGDLVCVALPTCEEFFRAFFGVQALGAVPVALYPTLGAV